MKIITKDQLAILVKIVKIFFILSLVSVVAILPFFRQGFPYTHDGENHLARFANYKIALKEGQFPPRWAPNLVNRYGYPVFNFNYPLSNILSIPFSALGINYQLSFKLIVFFYVFLGVSGIWAWSSKKNASLLAKIMGIFSFVLSTYLLNLIYFRGSIGEIAAMGIIPWLFYFIPEAIKGKKSVFNVLLSVFFLSLFLLSHNVAVLVVLPIIFFYCACKIFRSKKYKKIFTLLLIFLWSVVNTLWFWLPALMEKKYTNLSGAELSIGLADHFLSVKQLFFSPLQFGYSNIGSVDGLGFSLGVLGLVILLVSLANSMFYFSEKKIKGFDIIFFTFTCIGLLIFQLSVTNFFWQTIPIIRYVQFPWRLGILMPILISFLIVSIYRNLSFFVKAFLWLALIIQVIAVVRLQPIDYFNKTNVDYDAFAMTTSTQNENLPLTFTYSDFSKWQPTPEILKGNGEISVKYLNGSRRNYNLVLFQESTVVEPTANFPGWRTKVTNLETNQSYFAEYYNDDEIGGRLAYKIPAGKYSIFSVFTQYTWPRIVGNTLSLFSFIIFIITVLKYGKKFIKFNFKNDH